MRLLATADLHYNHPKSKILADDLIDRMNAAGGDALLLIGDTAAADGDALERCLERFAFAGPKMIVAGNHELWTHGEDSYQIFTEDLPRRVREMGWHWLQGAPFIFDDIGIVGSVGWYDYSFAQDNLGIPRRFYEAKISPGAAERFEEFAHLFKRADDISPIAREVVARWNDGRYVKLHRTDAAFLEELLADLQGQLEITLRLRTVVAAIHHLPLRELLPPPRNVQWDFAKAYLGSERIGELLLRYPNLRHALCGHSHLAMKAQVQQIDAINIGSGYRFKTFLELDL